tara:strand:- start:374 stop:526 length:153 start_codon:yes stop_codon:yes gene_type:complete
MYDKDAGSDMAQNNEDKPKKFFGFQVSDTVSYIVVVILALIFIRQVMQLF